LPAGPHSVSVQVARVYRVRRPANGGTETRTYALKGGERIELLGSGSKQSLVFNKENLKSKEIEDKDGH